VSEHVRILWNPMRDGGGDSGVREPIYPLRLFRLFRLRASLTPTIR